MEIPRHWRLKKQRLGGKFVVPGELLQPLQEGDISLAQATSPGFYENWQNMQKNVLCTAVPVMLEQIVELV